MKKTLSKSMSWILSVAMMFVVFVVGKNVSLKATAWSVPISETHFQRILDRLMEEYPHKGTYSGTYYEDGVAKAWQCHGYACEMFRQVFDAEYYNDHFFDQDKYTEMGTIYAGDIIKIRTSGGGHSMFVIEVRDNVIYVTEANWPGSNTIRWDRSYTYSELASVFEYKVHVPGNTLTGCGYSPPIGYFDGADSPAPNKLHVGGWAFDWDDLYPCLKVHVYIGGAAGDPNAERHEITADCYRGDVNATFGIGGNRGFDTTIHTSKTGTQEVHVYGINLGGGTNVELDHSPQTVNIQKDTQRPTVSNPVVSEVSENGYRFTCTVSDNIGVTSVKFPTWSGTNWQDDVVWHEASISGNKATAYIKSSDHKGDTGSYYTDIYAYDAAGNVSHDTGAPRTTIPQLKPYFVKYNLNGGSGSFPDQKRYYNGAAIKLNSAKPTKTGYSFVCWNTKSDGTGTNYNPSASYSDNADLTLYAIWKANTYIVSYNMNGGNGSIGNQTKTHGQDLTLSSTKPTRTDYTFVGWNTNASATTAQYSAGDKYTVNSGATLYAIWKAIDYNAIPTVKGNFNGHTYEFYNQALTWNQAYKFCERKGGHLITVSSKEENDFVIELTKDSNNSLWIGGKTQDYKTWYWITGETFHYQNWSEGEPNNYGGSQDAIKLYRTGKWDDEGVSGTYSFVCEYDNEIDASKYTPTYQENYNGHEYWFFEDAVDWQTAKKICEAKGGHLTVIDNADENNFVLSGIKKTSKENAWIGVTDIAQENVWKDVKGNPVQYSNWAENQPDNWLGIEDYVHLRKDGTWNDCRGFVPMHDSYGFVCEFDDLCTGSGHDYKLTSEKSATCTTDGEKIYICSRCGDTKTEVIEATDHDYEEKVIAPTTTSEGYTLHTCKRCGHSYKSDIKPMLVEKLVNSSTISGTKITLGDKLTVNAKASGGTGDYTYAVYYKKSSAEKWSTAQSYKANATISFKPAAAVKYDVCVKVKDSKGTIAKQYFTVTVTKELVNNSTVSATTVKKGSGVTVTAKATGGSGKYTYGIYYKKATSEKWTTAQSYGTNTSVTIKPAAAVKYNICVKVKDSSGRIVKKYFDITCTK